MANGVASIQGLTGIGTKLAIFAMAIGSFGIGTGEFAIMGLLPNLAGDLGVSEPEAGMSSRPMLWA